MDGSGRRLRKAIGPVHLTKKKEIKKENNKMKVTGIIMECNPFHEGHAYLLREARHRTQADQIVVVMSGDYVQRGEPAVYDKYLRAQDILRSGADLVLELPLYCACGSAEYFARGGIALLHKLGVVTDLCFGSETGDLPHLQECARILSLAETDAEASGRYRQTLQEGLRAGLSFPAARAAAVGGLPSAPNDLLGVEYCRALLERTSPIRPHAVPRIDVPSATLRRARLLRDRDIPARNPMADRSSQCLPEEMRDRSRSSGGDGQVPRFPLGPEDFSSQLLYALRMEADRLDTFADVSPDLARRILRLLPQFRGYSSFCDLVKTKNVTRTRVSRALLHTLLHLEKDRLADLVSGDFALYARPLAMRRSAAPLLSAIHKKASIPFLPRLSAASDVLDETALRFLREEIRAEELYTLTLRAAVRTSFSEQAPLPEPSPGRENPQQSRCPETGPETSLPAGPAPLAVQRKIPTD